MVSQMGRLMLYLDVYNATSRANPFIATYNYDYSELVEIASLPIIPTLGLRRHTSDTPILHRNCLLL